MARLWITGIASQYPPYLNGPEKLEEFAARFHDISSPSLKKLLQINQSTGIATRASIRDFSTSTFGTRAVPPNITEIDQLFRQAGVDLAAQACRKALKEWGGARNLLTHTVAVTITNTGAPGYDLLVARKLDLPADIDRTLLSGVGCAGGLAIMRAAAQLALGATARGRPARILCFACELCSPNVRHDLAEVAACADPAGVGIAPALFSDGAAAFVLCNELALQEDEDGDDYGSGKGPLFELLEFGNALMPDTVQFMGFHPTPTGFQTILTRDVPAYTQTAIEPMFRRLLPAYRDRIGEEGKNLDVVDFDWALHPGGEAIISGAIKAIGLTDEQLRATWQIYRTRGNSSSPTVLAVLDLLRNMGEGRDHVVATSFGPGLAIEMAMLRRCRQEDDF